MQLELILFMVLLAWGALEDTGSKIRFWGYWLGLSLTLAVAFYIRSMPFVMGLFIWGSSWTLLAYFSIASGEMKKIAVAIITGSVFPLLLIGSWNFLWGWGSFLDYSQAYMHLIKGSSSATALYPDNPLYVFAAIAGLLLLFWRYTSLKVGFKGLLVLLSLLFVKYGFGREDPGHLYYVFMSFVLLGLFLVLEKHNRDKPLVSFSVLALFSLFWIGIAQGVGTDKLSFPTWRPVTNLQYFLKSSVAQEHYQVQQQKLNSLYRLPFDWQGKFQKQSVGFFPWDMGFLDYMDSTNYSPAPVFQLYAAYTPELDSLNAQHFKEPELAPNFVVWHGMPRNEEDFQNTLLKQHILNVASLTSQALLNHYCPVDRAGQLALWEREPGDKGTWEQHTIELSGKLGEWVSLPECTGNPDMASISPRYNFWGHLVNYIYKAPPLWIDYRLTDGRIRSYRLNMLNARKGVYLHPETFSILNGFKGKTRTQAFRLRSSWEWGMRDHL
jgi:hypothetical protein